MTSSIAIGFEDQIVGNNDPDREARPDGDGRLDIERSSDHLRAGLVEALRGALADRLRQIVLAVAGAGLGPDAEQRREDRGLEQAAPMIVDLILKPGIASCSCAICCCSGLNPAAGVGMPGAGAPALTIARPRSPGIAGPSWGAGFARPA
jgi:hypothetical protein